MTGLAAGMASGFPVLESGTRPGGICASYVQDGYTFEIGGGHWIFGGDAVVNRLLGAASEMRHYKRRSAVLFLGNSPDTRELRHRLVPYPIQDNLWALPEGLRAAALAEMTEGMGRTHGSGTMAETFQQHFGETLGRIFFDPFHERYTAGLHRSIAPQDAYKSPIDIERVRSGATRENVDAGYNATFMYPEAGLDGVSDWLAERCDVEYGAEVIRIDTQSRVLGLRDGSERPFDAVVATTPLDLLIEMAGMRHLVGDPDPHSAVLVLNLGVTLPDTPVARAGYHWIYVPDSTSGFHRVGYYSNVDTRFLPAPVRGDPSHASLYVETAFPGGTELTVAARDAVVGAIIAELQLAGLVDTVETAHPTWIQTAYTWRTPGSTWADRAIAECRARGVEPAGRYGQWRFQGIAASLKEGLLLGAALRHT